MLKYCSILYPSCLSSMFKASLSYSHFKTLRKSWNHSYNFQCKTRPFYSTTHLFINSSFHVDMNIFAAGPYSKGFCIYCTFCFIVFCLLLLHWFCTATDFGHVCWSSQRSVYGLRFVFEDVYVTWDICSCGIIKSLASSFHIFPYFLLAPKESHFLCFSF